MGISSARATTLNSVKSSTNTFTCDFLIIAGGGSGGFGTNEGGGGGAGGYRTSAGTSGANSSPETPLTLRLNTLYTVTIGSGAPAPTTLNTKGINGNNSVFHTITSIGGGAGGSNTQIIGDSGGSGGGNAGDNAASTNTPAFGTANQGFDGGKGIAVTTTYGGGGGGGAGGVGGNSTGTQAGNGGTGIASSITVSSITRAGGGGGSSESTAGNGAGGSGGGGSGGRNGLNPSNGQVNTGGGGGGMTGSGSGASGVSGIVIIKFLATYTATATGGLTHNTVTSSGYKIMTFTDGSGTVTFS